LPQQRAADINNQLINISNLSNQVETPKDICKYTI
jgi:hypothetical protein